MKSAVRRSVLCCLLVLTALLSGCTGLKRASGPQGKSYFNYFDTVSYVYSYAGDSAERFDRRSADASNLLKEYHELFDIYHEYSGINNLCTVNRMAGGEPLKVDEKLIDFLLYAKELYDLTDGEMNVMMGSVLSLWHECRTAATEHAADAEIPSREALEEAAKHMDINLLEIDRENSTVRITDPAASIDVGALGKGYATEMTARMLESKDCDGYVLNIGGNIRIIGTKPDGSSWVTGIKDPNDPESGEFAVRLALADTACVTSGVYERYFVVDGARYHHIIDKETLFPAEGYSSITIVTKDSGLADALSTALFCMSYEQGRALADSLDGVDVIWIFPDGNMEYTPGIAGAIQE